MDGVIPRQVSSFSLPQVLSYGTDPRGSLERQEVFVNDYDPESFKIYGFDGTEKFSIRGIITPTVSFNGSTMINFHDDRVLGVIVPDGQGGY